jgi:hypothetical protein
LFKVLLTITESDIYQVEHLLLKLLLALLLQIIYRIRLSIDLKVSFLYPPGRKNKKESMVLADADFLKVVTRLTHSTYHSQSLHGVGYNTVEFYPYVG